MLSIMDKVSAAIEISSKNVKLVVGYELQGQVYAVYTMCKPISSITENSISDVREEIVHALKSISQISDPTAKLNLAVKSAFVSLPPFGLEVYQVHQTTSVISSEQKVCETDINNVYNIIRNGNLPIKENELVDIVPNRYYLDDDRAFDRPPYGMTSRQVSISGKVHSLPSHIVNDYLSLFRDANIVVKRTAVSAHAAIELLSSYPETPDDFILVDIGSDVTTVSLAGQKQLFGSRHFMWGGDNITERIIESFNINEADAEKYKITYGIDNRHMNFSAPICVTDDGYGNQIKHYAEDLNKIIKSELDIFVKNLNVAIDDLLAKYEPSYKKLPMILIGGGSRLHGLVEYITPKVESDTVTAVTPKTLGARSASLFALLGLIYINDRYPVAVDENQPKVGLVTRNPK